MKRRRTTGPVRKPASRREDVDRSLLAENLRLTPHERMIRHDRALHTLQKLRRAMEKRHARP